MGKQRRHSNSKASEFFDYSAGKTRGKERNAFERRLQKDPFEAEAAEGLEMVSREEMEEDLRAAAIKIRRRTSRRRRITWYSAAAAVASLMIVATIFFNIDDGSMDRYKTAPEFEEAAQEQPSAPAIEKKERRKDVIPEAEPGLLEERLEGEIREEQQMPAAGQEDQNIKGAVDKEQRRPETIQENQNIPGAGEQDQRRPGAGREDKKMQAVIEKDQRLPTADQVKTNQENMVQEAEAFDLAEQKVIPEDLSRKKLFEEEVIAPDAAQDVTAREVKAREVAAEEKALAREIDEAQSKLLISEAQPVKDEMSPVTDDAQPVKAEAPSVAGEAPPVVAEAQKAPSQTRPADAQQEDMARQLKGRVQGVEITTTPQGQVSGVVYSAEDLEPLPGVSLFIKGSTTGTVSDINGKFTLNISDTSGNTLVAQSIGMKTEEIPLQAIEPMEIAMVPDALQLDEVVVVATGSSAEKTALTGVSTVKPDPVTSTEYSSATPVDGIINYKRYIDSTLTYPADAGSGEKEVVVLKFYITPDGRPYGFRVVRSPGDPFSEEAIRVVTQGPDWKPSTRDGVYVNDETRLRIVFRPTQQ